MPLQPLHHRLGGDHVRWHCGARSARTPRWQSTDWKRLGRTSRMGKRTLRRLLIIGASAVARWATRNGVAPGTWLGRILSRKLPMLVRVALANKMAHTAWAPLAQGGVYRAPAAAA